MIGAISAGGVEVHTTSYRGHTPVELANMAVGKIMYVGRDAHPIIRDQAEAFKERIHGVLVEYLTRAVKCDRDTISHRLRQAGHPELTKLLEM
jgi:hypothetical protein